MTLKRDPSRAGAEPRAGGKQIERRLDVGRNVD
jgi:hypothetical protein